MATPGSNETSPLQTLRSSVSMEQFEFLLWSLLVGYLGLLMVRHMISRRKRLPLPPGPRGWPIIGSLHVLGEFPHRVFATLADKYGPIMHLRLGSTPAIIVSSPQIAEEVLKKQDEIFASRHKSKRLEALTFDGHQGMVFSPYGPYHAYMRRICKEELLSTSIQERFKDARRIPLLGTVQSLLRKSEEEKPLAIVYELKELLGATMCRMLFHQITSLVKEFTSLSQELLHVAGAPDPADFIPWVGLLDPLGNNKKCRAFTATLNHCLQVVVDEHRNVLKSTGVNQKKDFVDLCLALSSQDGKAPMADGPIKALLSDIMLAGSDTSATAAEWTLAELLRNPGVRKRVQDEITSVVGTDRLVEESDIPKLKYLEQVVMESLRIHPIAPLLIPRESRRDCTIAGYHIPAGSRVFVNIFKIHRDPSVWENPLEFNPDRFSGPQSIHKQRFDYLPFGSGRRGCPGMNLGFTFLMSILSQLLHCFNWELPEGGRAEDIDWTEILGIVCPMKVQLQCVVKPRLPPHVYDQIDGILQE